MTVVGLKPQIGVYTPPAVDVGIGGMEGVHPVSLPGKEVCQGQGKLVGGVDAGRDPGDRRHHAGL